MTLRCPSSGVRRRAGRLHDATAATTPVAIVSVGDQGPNTGNHVHHNVLRARSSLVAFYGDAAVDMDIYCNRFEHTGTGGYAMTVRGTTHSGVALHHNEWITSRADGLRLRFDDNPINDGALAFCENAGLADTSAIDGNYDVGDVSFSAPPCSQGVASCWQQAGSVLDGL